MLILPPIIDRIRILLDQDTEQTVTYAALEARLALEKVCYDRLRQRHDYISHADLRAWTPSHVVNKVMAEVDQHVAQTMTLMVARTPDMRPEDDDFIEIGTQIGFNPNQISKLWNALSNTALHVRLPVSKEDKIPDYGNKEQIRTKIDEVIKELERLAKGTMSFSGIGTEVAFACSCGQINKRRTDLLKPGQSVSCLNPQCSWSYKVLTKDKDDVIFELEAIEVPCAACGAITVVPPREISKMRHGVPKLLNCMTCNYSNQIILHLYRADLPISATS